MNNPTSASAPRNKVIRRSFDVKRQQLVATRIANDKARARREQQLAREGEAAKAQLIKALHITSDALNTVQKKIQLDQERRPVS